MYIKLLTLYDLVCNMRDVNNLCKASERAYMKPTPIAIRSLNLICDYVNSNLRMGFDRSLHINPLCVYSPNELCVCPGGLVVNACIDNKDQMETFYRWVRCEIENNEIAEGTELCDWSHDNRSVWMMSCPGRMCAVSGFKRSWNNALSNTGN